MPIKIFCFHLLVLFWFFLPFSLSAHELEGTQMPYITLNNSKQMPVLGLGTWTFDDNLAAESVYTALKNGYRLIDTARYYGNEKGVGIGVRKAVNDGICKREDVFVTTKIAPFSFENFDALILEANEKLGLGYIDLMLIHQQGVSDKELYRAIERAVHKGIVKTLGISNFYTLTDYERITKGAEILPAVIQNENHLYYQNTALQQALQKDGVVIESYYPLGGREHKEELLQNKIVTALAKKYQKSAAQIILRWHVQSGYIAIPGASNPDYIAENINIFDFRLTDDEMKQLADLNTGKRYENW